MRISIYLECTESGATTALWLRTRKGRSAGGFRRLWPSKAVSRSACHRAPKGASARNSSFVTPKKKSGREALIFRCIA